MQNRLMSMLFRVQGFFLAMFLGMTLSTFAIAQSTPMPAEQAFQFQIQFNKGAETGFAMHWKMAPNYYLYRDSVQVKINGKAVRDLQLPPATLKSAADENSEAVYSDRLALMLPHQNVDSISKLTIRYQGCSKSGFCYPPVTKNYQVDAANQQLVLIKTMHGKNSVLNDYLTDQSHTKNVLIDQSLVVSLLLFFGLGILLAFTPCVLPMVPILVSIIAGHKKRAEVTTKRNIFTLCLAYVLGIAITYAFVGVFAAMLGSSIQVWMQKPLFIILGALIFVALGLSLFGLFDLYFFKGIQNAIADRTRHLKGGSHAGVFTMGVLSVLLISPCTTAPLIGVLLYIGQTGNMLLGAAALFVMGMGMGLPLLMVGMSADRWLPRTGAWMEWVKKFLGVLMIGMAVWLVTRVGVLPGYTPSAVMVHQDEQQFTTVVSLEDFDKQRSIAAHSRRPIMLDFYADWCASCISMEKNVFSNQAVAEAIAPFTKLRINLTANTSADEMLMKHFNVIAPPTVLFFDEQGREVDSKRIVGEVDANEFIQRVDTFITAGCDKNATC